VDIKFTSTILQWRDGEAVRIDRPRLSTVHLGAKCCFSVRTATVRNIRKLCQHFQPTQCSWAGLGNCFALSSLEDNRVYKPYVADQLRKISTGAGSSACKIDYITLKELYTFSIPSKLRPRSGCRTPAYDCQPPAHFYWLSIWPIWINKNKTGK
jgi:hypothetical protein